MNLIDTQTNNVGKTTTLLYFSKPLAMVHINWLFIFILLISVNVFIKCDLEELKNLNRRLNELLLELNVTSEFEALEINFEATQDYYYTGNDKREGSLINC